MNVLIFFLIISYLLSFSVLLYYRRKCDILEIPGHKIDFADFAALFLGWIPFAWWLCAILYKKAIHNVSEEYKAEIEERERDKIRFRYFKEFLELHNLTIKDVDEYIDSRSLLKKLLD